MSRRAGSLAAGRERRRSELKMGTERWSLLQNPFPPFQVLDEDGLERIDATAFRILEELGLEFQSARALDILAANGADVNRETRMVRFDR